MNPEIKRELDDVPLSTTFSLGSPDGGKGEIRIYSEKLSHLWYSRPEELINFALTSVVQLVGASSCKRKGCRFDSQSGHMPGF